jgi:hypothetical protein
VVERGDVVILYFFGGVGDETFADCTLDITVMSNESSLSSF